MANVIYSLDTNSAERRSQSTKCVIPSFAELLAESTLIQALSLGTKVALGPSVVSISLTTDFSAVLDTEAPMIDVNIVSQSLNVRNSWSIPIRLQKTY